MELRRNGIRRMCKVSNDVQIINKQTVSSSTTTTTTVDDTHPPSPPCHCRFIATSTPSSPSTTPTFVHIRRPQPAQHERRGNATSPNKRAPATSTTNSSFVMFIRASPWAMSPPSATWQPGNERGHRSLSVATTQHHYNTTTTRYDHLTGMCQRPPHGNVITTTEPPTQRPINISMESKVPRR
ncbi:hypothetical protein K443DRAFT_7287 [Laccaria amethystina LaAM-08-1]|uniref:Uncharacterized protein n=1 Tax=Laccaria amethystina LaAM-08-1 TaxID=1095629 RepID=A0A0C9XYU9_9AGAR|nr:hypothetical protein K443DRAFT_7287 [Laccaria amethystina LaAM-08-1]